MGKGSELPIAFHLHQAGVKRGERRDGAGGGWVDGELLKSFPLTASGSYQKLFAHRRDLKEEKEERARCGGVGRQAERANAPHPCFGPWCQILTKPIHISSGPLFFFSFFLFALAAFSFLFSIVCSPLPKKNLSCICPICTLHN